MSAPIQAAESLSRAAFIAASGGALHRARRLGREALVIDGSSAALWHLVGLSALAVGDIREAFEALRVADSLAPGGDASALAASIQGGPAHAALKSYNRAVEQAKSGKMDAAAKSAEKAMSELPQFVPAARLLGLIRAQQGRLDEARGIWRTALASCTDDQQLLQLLAGSSDAGPVDAPAPATERRRGWPVPALIAASMIVLVLMSVAAWRRSSDAVVQDPVSAAPSQTDTAALARTVGQLLAADSDSAVETLRALSAYSRRWPAAAQRRAAEIGRQRGLVHFRAGEKAFREANWAQAARELSWAVTYGGGSDYHANAMYLLARTHARNAQPVSARIQAQEMLRQYPKSRYADAVMRRIASTGSER